jgi:phage anti-repressor protein
MQMGRYLENRDAFTNAVKEFTAFVCQNTIGDLIKIGGKIPFNFLNLDTIPRFDNLGFILESTNEKTVGKIALVDLDEFSSRPGGLSGVENAIHFFPYHIDEIIEVARRFIPDIDRYRSTLERIRNDALVFYHGLYVDHATFLKSKGITTANSNALAQISSERKVEREEFIFSELLKILRKPFQKKMVTFNVHEDSEELRQKLKNIAPVVLTSIESFISQQLESKSPMTSEELVSARQIHFYLGYYNPTKEMVNAIISELKRIDDIDVEDNSGVSDYERLAHVFINIALTEMVKGGEIAYYNTQNHGHECIIFV